MTASPGSSTPQIRAFDFLIGSWTVRHRRLEHRLVGDTHWQSFGGTMRAQPILAGQGNFDEHVIDLPGGLYRASTLRIFHADTGQWEIRWIDGRDPKLDPPMTGAFSSGVGTFHGESAVAGKPARARFLWSRISESFARWEQAFSPDSGASWETNWIMEFIRT